MASEETNLVYARSLIRTIQDYPQPGVAFRDITPLLGDGKALRAVAHGLLDQASTSFDVVAGIEARGFIFAGAVAAIADTGMLPIRKAGKLPVPAHQISYDKEYGPDTLEVSPELKPGMRVLLIDDILATGGTLKAGADLIELAGAQVAGVGVVMELEGLGGRRVMPQTQALFTM
ncbi:adenine phosphoribosyltransferase [Enteractinococcus fodinae]|uniref:Adenine phosphoribosyltransferase n=1 Tax=Enteractinococcus fodinae TaxID=684663 RepID=A0ABU2B161_9MICC|nr:adenine phosphoribosyltransferase [Enteractinococcus fodinae]MDR7347345.1 adenine phosphoribosyltransferase [Enteractinococcus fodinae]